MFAITFLDLTALSGEFIQQLYYFYFDQIC